VAKGLDYKDPASDGWRLTRDPSSTAQRLVLNLVGPAGLKSRGAAFNLKAPGAIRFVFFSESGFAVRDPGVYQLLNSQPAGVPDPLEPKLLLGVVKGGNLLTAGVFQKDRRIDAKDSGSPLFQIALELDPAAAAHVGDALALRIVKSRYMAEDIGAFSPTPTLEQAAKAHLVDMSIAVGALHAN
jgi:hypothetical protein